jgi:predicted S18 family serine protease
MEQVQQESFNKLKEENERIKSKMFYLENIIIKKDNLLQSIKKKYDKLYSMTTENSSVNILEKEFYV